MNENDRHSKAGRADGLWDRRDMLRAVSLPCALAVAGATPQALAQASTQESRSRTVRVNGVTLHYLEWGDASARPMVLLHPAPLNAHAWERFGPAMARRFHVIAPDARGFGESDWSDDYAPDTFLGDVDALMTTLKLQRPILCGNSMGGTLAFMTAGRHPERVERLILLDTGPGDPPGAGTSPGGPPGVPAGPPPVPPGPFTSVDEAAAAIPKIMGSAFVRAMVDHNLKRTDDGRWAWKYDHARTGEAAARSMADTRKWPLWQSVQCPTLVLRGERSPALSAAAAERMVAGRTNTTLAVIPGAGHFIPIEAPAALEAAVSNWLGVR